jgi:membrane fusion protein, type I secretion system
MEAFVSLEAEAAIVGKSLRTYTRVLAFIVVVLIGGIVAWSNLMSIQGAVIASGSVISEGNKKLVQHRDGGVIDDLMIEDGDRVNAGDVLVKLDGRQLSSELEGVEKKLQELRLRQIRLDAEAQDRPIDEALSQFTATLKKSQIDELETFINTQLSLYNSRKQSYQSRLMQLDRRISALRVELQGSKELVVSKHDELKLIDRELGLLSKLEAKSLVTLSRIAPLRRERARIQGELARNRARASKIPEQLAEANAEVAEVGSQRTADVLTELQNAEAEILQNVERREILVDRLARLDIRAPASGYIHELTAHTKGGVIQAGATIASIVPEDASLSIDAKINVNDRDSVANGMPARIRFTAFNSRSTPEVEGSVRWLSPDISSDEKTGVQYFQARINIPEKRLQENGSLQVSPGMMAEVLITTHPRTVASYLVKPIVDQFTRAFRED